MWRMKDMLCKELLREDKEAEDRGNREVEEGNGGEEGPQEERDYMEMDEYETVLEETDLDTTDKAGEGLDCALDVI